MPMPPHDPKWIQFAQDREITHLMNLVDSKVHKREDFKPDMPVLGRLVSKLDRSKPQKLIDFGAGLLRNSAGLCTFSPQWEVCAYDCHAMLRRGWWAHGFTDEQWPRHRNLACVHDWQEVRAAAPFDALIAFTVFQHLAPDNLRAVLEEVAPLTRYLCVYGRRHLDGEETSSAWDFIAQRYDMVECEAEIDPRPNAHSWGIFTAKP